MRRLSHGFDFTAAMCGLCRDMVSRLRPLSHIDMDRVALSLCHSRRRSSYGIYASLTPLRFEAGARERIVRRRRYGIRPLFDAAGREYLYILSFYLPRFQDRPLEEKLSTVVHELWHVSPRFDGDVRRHAGRCYAHGPSQRDYDAQMDRLAQQWLALDPPGHLYEFLTHDFPGLVAEYSGVTGTHWRMPELVPLPTNAAC